MNSATVTAAQTAVSTQTKITLFFSLSLLGGEVIDSNFDKAPAQFSFGDGSLLPRFEAALLGLRAGDKRQFLISAAEAFGLRQDANLKRIPRARFAVDMPIEPGLVVSFAAKEGGELPAVIHRLMGDIVEIDFNHPLAGHDIVFDVAIVSVSEA
jgi:FKBP-type peptidyl-prolyl cis-trans isomerase SlpA